MRRALVLLVPILCCNCRATHVDPVKRLAGTAFQRRLVAAAREQLSWGTQYDNAYYRIGYPMGDLPKTKGVCTDIVVRAYRAVGFDLQKLVHEDIGKAWAQYPRYSGNPKPDSNIDHRRCPNLTRFFTRHGTKLATNANWQPGDIVFWKLPSGLDHVGLVSDRVNLNGKPLVIHNIGTPAEEDVLSNWKIVGHYRFPK